MEDCQILPMPVPLVEAPEGWMANSHHRSLFYIRGKRDKQCAKRAVKWVRFFEAQEKPTTCVGLSVK